MQAFKIALSERKFRILELLIGLTQQMVEGELMQMEKLGKAISESEYNDLIYRKTACLFEVSMRLGACLSGADRPLEDAMGEYGRCLGMAFQVIDDVLDLTATEQVLGKPVASDLREGKATLAVIHALENGILPSERNKIQIVLNDRNFNYVSHEEILRILNRSESVAYATNTAYAYAAAAQAALASLPESDYKRALQWMPEFVVARDK
jgi:octaprenyl-diphosphate synthase